MVQCLVIIGKEVETINWNQRKKQWRTLYVRKKEIKKMGQKNPYNEKEYFLKKNLKDRKKGKKERRQKEKNSGNMAEKWE